MKNVLNWFKKHWVIPTLSVAILAILGTTWWFSNSWNEQIRDEQQKKASDLLTKVKGVQVTYALPLVAGETKAVELQTPPNSVITAKFSESRKRIIEQRESVVKIAEAFNKGDKKPLVDGLFPSPAAGQEQLKPLELVQKLIGNPTQGTPSAYQLLLDSIRAGGPIASTQLEAQLNDIYRREAEKLRGANATRELTQPEKESLARQLLDARRSEYIRRANEVSVYADMSVFPSAGSSTTPGNQAAVGANQIVLAAPGSPPSVRQAFLWQSDYWLLQDIFAIVRNANSIGGKLVGVRDAVVKRIEKIEILPWKPQTVSEGGPGVPEGAPGAPPPPTPTPGGDFTQSISGHGEGSTTYDTRRARVTLIVSSQRLPELFDAIGRSNFAFIVGIALEKVDSWSELERGYYYGDENVVRVLLDIEVTWLRSWTEPLFPPVIRKGLGIPDPPPPPAPAGEQQPPK